MRRRAAYGIIEGILAVLIIFPTFACGQDLEFIRTVCREGWVKVADANNDDKNEVLFGFGYGSRNPQAVILGSGYSPYDILWRADMSFDEAPHVTVDIGDVNNDGENEVIVMNASPHDINSNGKIRIYEHTGGNNYGLLWSQGLSEGFRRLAIGNTDDDPEKEFVVGNAYYDRRLYIYNYQGGNTWSKSAIEFVGEDCFGVKIADVDADGQNEIIVGLGVWPPYSVRIYKYMSGSYQRIWQYTFWSGSPYGDELWLDVGDTDNDGENEILVCEQSTHKECNDDDVFIFDHAGGTNWALSWSASAGPYPNTHGAYSPLIGKILNNGLNQFAFVSMDTMHVYEFQSGTYEEVLVKPLDTKLIKGQIFGGDADNDGNYEVLRLAAGQLSIYRGSGQSLEFLQTVSGRSWANALKVGDADNDAQNELLYGFAYQTKNPQAMIFGPAYGSLDALWRADIPFAEATEVAVDMGDVNNDGENEVIVMNTSPHDVNPNGKIRIYKHTGGNNYGLLWSQGLSEGFRRLAIGNTDDDPEKEFVIGNAYYDRRLYVYDYQGANVWTKSAIEYVGEDCYGLKIADADNDGQNEIVVGLGIWPPYSVRIYKYLSGSYQRIWQYSFWSGSPYGPAYTLDVGDTDNDGENEILVCEMSNKEGNSDDAFIFEHSGGANWTLSWSTSTGTVPGNYGAYSPLIGKILNTPENQFAFVSMDTIYVYEFQSGTYEQILLKPLDTKRSMGQIFGGDVENDGNYEILCLASAQLSIYRGSRPEAPEIDVHLDIKPGSCPNPLNVKSKGLLPVAILGTEEFDVTQVDVSTVELIGVAPKQSGIEHVATPVENKQNPCDCTDEGSDGYDDLTLKFKTEDIVKALGEVEDGQEIELTLTGALNDGTEIEGLDCVVIIKKGKGGKQTAGVEPGIPKVFALSQNSPNPFSRETTISFSLPAAMKAKLRIYDPSGRVVATLVDEDKEPGLYSVSWDGRAEDGKKVVSGAYFVRLEAERFEAASKMIVVQ
ncbi:T9SS type A sorting domain-containing protein [candidate division TA06 bacterium]|uniref:T9SS type A sorting domain-containing protein n=1 Tax=candidate division TA06 bacterium TaxID=2250710 RepID=A0A523UXH0_UNCT6|nr:MAG: T9SS type A sorting domain-containing protein [candidate division TA06 bacterium]